MISFLGMHERRKNTIKSFYTRIVEITKEAKINRRSILHHIIKKKQLLLCYLNFIQLFIPSEINENL